MSEPIEELILLAKKKRALADYYYDNYRKYYEARDFVKASEFLWGAVSSLTVAIGLLYGEKISRHKEIINFIEKLLSEQGREKIRELLSSAECIHANFYHNFMDELTFENNRRKVEELLEILAGKFKEKFEGIF